MNVPGAEQRVFYDRQLLLGEKRNALLELWEVQQYGIDSYGDPDYVSIYVMRTSLCCSRESAGIGRAGVVRTCGKIADAIAKAVAATAAAAPVTAPPLVIDPFAGSANTLYWLSRHLPLARTRGFELD